MQDAGQPVDTLRISADRRAIEQVLQEILYVWSRIARNGHYCDSRYSNFGLRKIPELGNALGKTLRSFKEGVGQSEDEAVEKEKEKEEKSQSGD